MGKNKDLLYEDLSYIIRGVAFNVYKELRNNHKEKVYQKAFKIGLERKNVYTEREKRIPVNYKGEKVGVYIPDLVVEEKVMIELKAKKLLVKADKGQFWYYLINTDYKLGFLINFGKPDGVQILRRIHTP